MSPLLQTQFLANLDGYHLENLNLQTSECKIQFFLQVGKEDIQLDVLYAPSVTLPNSREVNENADVEIDCGVDANPRPTSIQWYKEGDERFIQNGPTLRLKGVTAFHNGRYICSASNILQPTGKR